MQKLIDTIQKNSDFMAPIQTAETSCIEVLPEIRAVLFDLYGTLFLSGSGDVGVLKEAQSSEALQKALPQAAFTPLTDDAGACGRDLLLDAISCWHTEAQGRGVTFPEVDIREIWQGVLQELVKTSRIEGEVTPDRVEQLAVAYESLANPCWPMPGVQELGSTLRERELLMGMVSNAQFYTPLLFKALLEVSPEEWGCQPDLCLYSYEWLEAKPSKRLFSEALDRLRVRYGVAPDQVVYVGNDMLNDVWAASESGCRTVLFAGDQRSLRLRADDDRCGGVHADAVITDLRELLQVLPIE